MLGLVTTTFGPKGDDSCHVLVKSLFPSPLVSMCALMAATSPSKGPKGQLQRSFKGVTFDQADGAVTVTPDSMSRTDRSLWGLGRTLLNNMVVGVSEGFTRELEINGVGYRAAVKGQSVEFNLGYSHPIDFPMPEGVKIEVDKQTMVKVRASVNRLSVRPLLRFARYVHQSPTRARGEVRWETSGGRSVRPLSRQ